MKIKKIRTIIMACLICTQANVSVSAANAMLPEESNTYYTESYYEDLYHFYSYHMDGFLWNDLFSDESSFSYAAFYNNMDAAPEYFHSALDSALFIIEESPLKSIITGDIIDPDQIKIGVYESSLLSLLMTIDMNEDSDDVESMAYVENNKRKGALDIAIEGIDAAIGLAGLSTAGAGSTAIETLGQAITVLDTTKNRCKLFLDELEECERTQILASSERYELFRILLTAIIENSDNALMVRAAENVLDCINIVFLYQLNNVSEIMAENAEMMGDYFTDLLNHLLSQESFCNTLSEEENSLFLYASSIGSILKNMNIARNLGLFLADVGFGSSNIIMNCYDIEALVYARRAVSAEIEKINDRIHSSADFEQMYTAHNLLTDLMYIDMRGEECIYQIVMEDGGVLQWFTDQEKTEHNYQKMKEVFSNVRSILNEMLPNWDYYRTASADGQSDMQRWINYYDTLQFTHGALKDSTITYGGEAEQRYAVQTEGQGFMGGCVIDLDMDGTQELVAVGNWYQGSLNSEGIYENDYTALEIWVYDCVDGGYVSTRVYHDDYCGQEGVRNAFLEAEAFVHISGGVPYIVVMKNGNRPDSDVAYYETEVYRYKSDQSVSAEMGFSTRNSECAIETIENEQRWNLSAYTLDLLHQSSDDDIVIGKLSMDNQYAEGVLSDGRIMYQQCNDVAMDIRFYLDQPILLTEKLGMISTITSASSENIFFAVEDAGGISLPIVYKESEKWFYWWNNRQAPCLQLFGVEIGDSLGIACDKMREYAAVNDTFTTDIIYLVAEDNGEYMIRFELDESGFISGWGFGNYFDSEYNSEFMTMFDSLHKEMEQRLILKENQGIQQEIINVTVFETEENEIIPLTMEEVEQILTELGYQSVIVTDYEGKYSVFTYYNTYLSYTMTVDPVTGIAAVGFQGSDGSMGTLDIRNRAVISGNPLPAVPTVEAAKYTEPLSRNYVENRLMELGMDQYVYSSEDEQKYVYYDNMTMWYIEVYKYSGQLLEYNYRGVIYNNFFIDE